ncbi:MAG: hypothetical protein WDN67_01775 [Candidatus Moraniibacteriota bacterium]
MKIIDIICKIIFCLIIAMPILGALGIFPEPTADLYNTPEAFAFIQALSETKYILYINAIVFAASIILLITGRTALAALLVLPITVNVVAFHLFLDGGLLTPGAIMADVMLFLNLYFLWQSRTRYLPLWVKSSI